MRELHNLSLQILLLKHQAHDLVLYVSGGQYANLLEQLRPWNFTTPSGIRSDLEPLRRRSTHAKFEEARHKARLLQSLAPAPLPTGPHPAIP
jgi:hypothetical protein